jgi:hypothetical protein
MTQLPPAAHSSCSASQCSAEVGSSAAVQKRASSSISGTPSTPLSCLAAVLLPAPPRPSRTTRLNVPIPPASQVITRVAPGFRSTALSALSTRVTCVCSPHRPTKRASAGQEPSPTSGRRRSTGSACAGGHQQEVVRRVRVGEDLAADEGGSASEDPVHAPSLSCRMQVQTSTLMWRRRWVPARSQASPRMVSARARELSPGPLPPLTSHSASSVPSLERELDPDEVTASRPSYQRRRRGKVPPGSTVVRGEAAVPRGLPRRRHWRRSRTCCRRPVTARARSWRS